MCLTTFYINPDWEKAPKHHIRFAIWFNREERWDRETIPLGKFSDDENMYGARDVEGGGTWLGVNTVTNNICFLTNRYILPLMIA